MRGLCKKNVFFFDYIAPRKLNQMEEEDLELYVEKEPQYVKGIREGWSILAMGKIEECVIVPGRISRADMVKQIPKF